MSFYNIIADLRGDSDELRDCVVRTTEQLDRVETSTWNRPGILLGRIQSGKTRAFLGIIACAFDKGFDVAIVLTKGTKSLAQQTVSRINKDFKVFIDADQVRIYDILQLPSNLAGYELRQKLILVVKKEDDNLRRLLTAFKEQYPSLKEKRLLIVDDEADYASVTFRRQGGVGTPGVVAQMIDDLQRAVPRSDFLQVTATPYALYLQPESEIMAGNGEPIFLPKRPSFTEILPIHEKYVGGEYYFELADDADSAASYFYRPVPDRERDALRKPDGRRMTLDGVLTQVNTEVIRAAFMTFIVGGTIRRWQDRQQGENECKYSFLFHTETATAAHGWQQQVFEAMHQKLVEAARSDSQVFDDLLDASFGDLRRSLERADRPIPSRDLLRREVRAALVEGFVVISRVNSENDVDQLLDDEGQLKLRTPFNVFIGGQILDRGITIAGLIGFYYGRNPKTLQQDTVLQHCRMYGARPKADLPVTRFYSTQLIYDAMRRIHQFDSALREAFVKGAHNKGVYFVQRDASRRVIPCSPNKLTFSSLTAVRPGHRLLPIGLQTVARSNGEKRLRSLDERLNELCPSDGAPVWIPSNQAIELLESTFALFDSDTVGQSELRDLSGAIHHFARICQDERRVDKVCLVTWRNRNLARFREAGRYSNAPDTKQQKALVDATAGKSPAMMMFRQEGGEENGWRGLPFWWPVVVTPPGAAPVVFSDSERNDSVAERRSTERRVRQATAPKRRRKQRRVRKPKFGG